MIFKRVFIVFVFSLIEVFVISSSHLPDEVTLELDKKEKVKIARLEKDFENAFVEVKDAISFYESIKYNPDPTMKSYNESQKYRALVMLRRASRTFARHTEKTFDVYIEVVDGFWNNHSDKFNYGKKIYEAMEYTQKAKALYKKSVEYRNIIEEQNDFLSCLRLHFEALESEYFAMRYACRAARHFQDFPIEYDYRWNNDYPYTNYVAKQNGEPEESVFDPEKKKETELVRIEKPMDTVEIEKPKPIKVTVFDTVRETYFMKDTIEISYDIVFMVQIAASFEPIAEKEIKELYDGPFEVKEILEKEWYKYQIGPFRSYHEAQAVLEKVNLEEAFIPAYNFGDRFSTADARKLFP